MAPLIHSLGQHHSPAPVSSAKNTGNYSGRLGGPYSRFGVLEKRKYLPSARRRPPYQPFCRLVAIRTALYQVLHRNAKSVQKRFGVQDNMLKEKEIFLSLKTSRTALGPNQVPIHRIPAVLSTGHAM